MLKLLENQSEQSVSTMKQVLKDYFILYKFTGNRPGGDYGIPLAYSDDADQEKLIEMMRDYNMNRGIDAVFVSPDKYKKTVRIIDFEGSYV